VSGDLVRREELGEVVAQLSSHDLDHRERGRLLARLTALVAAGVRAAGGRATVSGKWLADLVTELAPHVPVRDLLTLRQHHEGRSGDQLAESLIAAASRSTAGVGAAGGALSALELAAPPLLLTAPVQLAAETLAVIAIELKLVAELHVAYGRTPTGTRAQVATAYVSSWASKHGIDVSGGPPSMLYILTAAGRQQLRGRVLRRLGRNVTTLTPFLAGAVAGAELNRRETRKLGTALVKDLRKRR
jgi:hypothetical protein